MRLLLLAALGGALLGVAPARADAPGDGFAPRHHRYGHLAPRRYGHVGRRHFGGYAGYAPGPAYGPLPPFYTGLGGGAAHLHGGPVQVTLYREAYIARGLIYNTPPTLDVPASVVSARY